MESTPLFVQFGLRRLLRKFVIFLVVSFFVIISTGVDQNFSGFALVFGFGTAIIALVNYMFLLLSKDYEFHDDYLKVIKFGQTAYIPYWMIQRPIQVSDPNMDTASKSFVLKIRIRGSREVLNIKYDTLNEEIRARFQEFLLKRTAPMILY